MDEDTLLVSADEGLADLVRAAAAATGAGVRVCAQARAAARWWARAGTVLVGTDTAPGVAGLGLPVRPGVHVVGASASAVLAWSTPLQAAGLVLPDQAGMLASLLDPTSSTRDLGRADVLRIVGASGGLGASTLAAGLAVRAARRGLATVLAELDRFGGGVDLLFGAEDEPGWRWGDLTSARGRLAELRGHLPSVCGVDLIAVGRATPGGPDDPVDSLGFAGDEARRSVLAAARRGYDLVVLDEGTCPGPEADGRGVPARRASGSGSGWSGALDRTVLLVGADVRGVLAARAWLAAMGADDVRLVVRTGAGRRLDPALVAQTLEAPLLGALPHDGRAPERAEAGDPPGRARGRQARTLDALLTRAMETADLRNVGSKTSNPTTARPKTKGAPAVGQKSAGQRSVAQLAAGQRSAGSRTADSRALRGGHG